MIGTKNETPAGAGAISGARWHERFSAESITEEAAESKPQNTFNFLRAELKSCGLGFTPSPEWKEKILRRAESMEREHELLIWFRSCIQSARSLLDSFAGEPGRRAGKSQPEPQPPSIMSSAEHDRILRRSREMAPVGLWEFFAWILARTEARHESE